MPLRPYGFPVVAGFAGGDGYEELIKHHSMNVLYITEDYKGSKVHHQLTESVAESGVDVSVFSVVRHENYDPRVVSASHDCPIYGFQVPGRKRLRYKFDFRFKQHLKAAHLLQQVKVEEVDVVHASTLFSDGAMAYRLYKMYGIPYVVAVRGTDVNFYLRYMLHLWPLGRKILKHASKVVFITAMLKENFKRSLFVRGLWNQIEPKCVVLPNGIDDYWLEHQHYSRHSSTAEKLLYIGAFDRNKNVTTLMKAVEQLRKKHPHLTLTLVGGSGEEHERIVKMCEAHPEMFCYLGKIFDKDRLRDVMREHDVFTMVSHSETFGLVYVESLSQGLPILYTIGQGIDGTFREKVGEGADSHRWKDIARQLDRLLTNYEEYESIEKSIRCFSWKHIASQYKLIYQDAVR